MEQAFNHLLIHLMVGQRNVKIYANKLKDVTILHGEAIKQRLEEFVSSSEEKEIQRKKLREYPEVHTDAESQVFFITSTIAKIIDNKG